ncbi:MAG: hypothetical protein EA379_11245 [Phycisphaerales bacterium]|nr:MAG: hypothetical protein EA379_11245 [Phycisphaerales bacterium]
MNRITEIRRSRMSPIVTAALACVIASPLFVAGVAAAQTGAEAEAQGVEREARTDRTERRGQPRQRGEAGAREFSTEVMRERLTKRLNDIDAERARITDALTLIDDGAPAEEVLRSLRPQADAEAGERPRRWQRPNGAHGMRGHDGAHRPVPPHVRERMMEVLKERNPDLHRRMSEMRRNRPEAADRMTEFLAPRMQELSELSERDPALFELRMQALRLDLSSIEAARRVADLRRAGDAGDGLAAAEQELRGLVSQRIDLRLQERAHQAEQLSKRLEQARDGQRLDAERREQFVNRMTEEFVRRVDRDTRRN